MMFTGFVAWKLTECYQLAEGNEARPTIPAPIYGTTDGPTEPDAEAYLEASAPGNLCHPKFIVSLQIHKMSHLQRILMQVSTWSVRKHTGQIGRFPTH